MTINQFRKTIEFCNALLLLLLIKHIQTVVEAKPCSTRAGSQFCLLSRRGDLSISCALGAVALLLKFQDDATSWPSESGRGLRDCGSILQLKITGWGGPELQSGHTAQLPGLRKLEIQDGAVQRLGDNVCRRGLLELVLVRNRISDLNPEALSECDSLELLDLSDNRIGALPDRFLAACTKLRVLKLSGNRLEQLGPLALQGAPSLFELHAPRNRFRALSSLERAFESNRQLSIIDLRHNVLFAYLPSSADGLCGPDNVTVLLHFAGCAPSPADSSICREARRHRCLGSSAHLVVTFNSCVMSLDSISLTCSTQPITRASTVTCPTMKAEDSHGLSSASGTNKTMVLRSLGLYPDGVWLLYALAFSVAFSLIVIIVSLIVCHQLKLRLARLEARYTTPLSMDFGGDLTLCNYQILRSRQSLQPVKVLTATPAPSRRRSSVDGASQCDVEIPDDLALQLLVEDTSQKSEQLVDNDCLQ